MITEIAGFTYDCKDACALAMFYKELLGWKEYYSGDGWAALRSPQGWVLSFQEIEEYVKPVWPWAEGKQQQMAHLDFYADDLENTVKYAESCGAKKSDIQYFETSTVMFDPEGHPFCLSAVKE